MRKFTYFYSLLLTALFLLPWSGVKAEQLNEGFEGTAFPPDGWKVETTKGTKSWASSTTKHSGLKSAYANYGPSTGNDTYLITPQLTPADGESLSFWFYAQYTNYQTTIQVEVSTTDNEVASFGTVVETYVSCSTGDNTFSNSWKNFTIDLSAYKGQDIYIAFHVIDANGNNVFLDDVSGVTLKPESCPKPGTPEASDVTSTTATISWTQGGTEATWNLRYKKSTTSVWTEVNGLISASYDLTGLTAGKTTYNYEVQADCGGGETSDWKAGTDFQTECGVIESLPWECDFTGTSTTIPSCWVKLRTSDEVYDASIYSNSLRFSGNSSNTTRKVVMVLPQFQTDIKNLKISFKHQDKGTSNSYPQFQVGYVTDPNDVSTFTLIQKITRYSSGMTSSGEVSLADAASGSYIAICYNNPDGGSTSGYAYLDDVKVESNIDCSKPATPVASDITGTSAHVAWTANAGVTSYKYIYQTSGSAAPDETAWESATTISANSVDLTGLTDGQAYDFYVMCACGTEASDPCTFISSSCPTVTDTWLSEQTYSSVKVSCVLSIADKTWDLQKSVDNGAWESVATEIADAYKAVAVEVDHSYAFQVKPSCGSDWTDAGSFEPAYPIPGTPSVTPAETSASVTWTAADGADGYEYVLMPGTTAASWTGAKNATSPLALNELTDGTNYTVYVRAKYGEGRSAEVSKNFTTATIAPAFTSAAATIEGTTATVALNEYTGTATKFQYVVMNGTAAANWTSATLIDKTESLVISSGLSVGNSYTVYVRAYYSATIQSAADSKLFEIACEAETLPFSYGFEDASLSGCWKTLRTNENYNLPVISSADKYGESGNSLRFYGSTSQKAVVVLPQFETSIDQLILSFYYKNASTASSRPQFKVGYVTNPDNASTFVEKKSLTRETSWTATGDIDFSKFDGIPAGAYMAIAYTGGSTDAAGYIDDIEVTDVPACEAPTDLKVMTVGATSARFFWTSTETSWKLQYKAEGDADWSEVSVNTNPFDLTGLTIATNYQAKIQSACGSAFTDAVEFTTWCNLDDAANLSLEEDFTAGTKPACFEFLSTTEYPQITSNKIWFQGTNKQIVVLPSFDIELNKLSLKFDFSVNYAVFEFGYFTTDGSEFQSLGIATESGKEIDLSTTSAPDAAGYLAIRYNYASSPYASGSVDNIRVRKTPTCLKPTNLDATPGVGSLNISWTAGTETAWNLQYKTGSADWTTVPVTENPYLLSGLEQGVSYTVHVQADCGGEQSDWSDEAQFTTKCATIDALPFIADFSQALSSCWKTYAATSYNIYISNEELKATAPKTTGNESVVVLPAFDAALNTLGVSFDYKGSNGTIEVGYVTDAADKTTFVAVGEAFTVASAYKLAVTPLASVNEAGNIAIRFKGNTGDGDFTIDNLRVATTLALADNTDNTATLSANLGKTLDVVIGRTFVCADYYNTICLPFSLSAAELAASPIASEDLWAFKYAKVEGDELLIRIVEAESINAGEPYLISWPEGDNIENPLFKNVTISASVGKVMGNENLKFVGTLKPETFAAHDDTKLFLYQNNTLYWWNGDAASSLKSFRAFFTVEGGAGEMPIKNLPARIIKEEQETTGIDNTGVDARALKLLENGCVVIIRNGVKYNIQGQVIEK